MRTRDVDDDRPVVVVTGCSSGFGVATAVELSRRDVRVIATMRDVRRRGDLDSALSAAGRAVEVVELDVCSGESIRHAAAAVLELTAGRVDGVVHNAGVADAGFFEDMPEEVFRHVMETNFFGPCALTRELLPAMRARGKGVIVSISSVAGFVGQPAITAYTASKRALEGWSESLAVEVRPFGISVALVQPGTYRTAIWTNSGIQMDERSPYAPMARRMNDRVGSMVGRVARDPQEVAVRVADLVTGRRTSFINPMGPDARFLWRPVGRLPHRLRLRLVGRISGATAGAREIQVRDDAAVRNCSRRSQSNEARSSL